MKRKKMRSPLINSVVLQLSIFLFGCEEEVVSEQRLRPVKHIVVQSGAGAIRDRVFSGTAHSAQEADLSFKVSGTVSLVAVEVGDKVKPGDLIAELNADTFRLELEQARAAAARTNASRRSAEADYQRVRQLYTNDNASRTELDTALASAESAKASHNADLQSVRLATLNLDYTRLTVDAGCSVASVDIETNENVATGQTVAQVSCGERWEIKIAVPESLIGAFRDGLLGTARFSAVAGQIYKGIVTEVGVGTSDSATFPVTMALSEVPSAIRSNLAAEVTFQFANGGDDKIHVPASAVVQDEQGTFVYIMETTETPGAAKLTRRSVSVGEVSQLGLEIASGLVDGERVVTAGQINAREGLLVRDGS